MKPFPPPVDGTVLCKAGNELQVQLIAFDAAGLETSLNQNTRPTATSSNSEAAGAEVPANTGHQVRIKCLSEGKTIVTASYPGASSANIKVSVTGDIAKSTADNTSSGDYTQVTAMKDVKDTENEAYVTARCPTGMSVTGGGFDLVFIGTYVDRKLKDGTTAGLDTSHSPTIRNLYSVTRSSPAKEDAWTVRLERNQLYTAPKYTSILRTDSTWDIYRITATAMCLKVK